MNAIEPRSSFKLKRAGVPSRSAAQLFALKGYQHFLKLLHHCLCTKALCASLSMLVCSLVHFGLDQLLSCCEFVCIPSQLCLKLRQLERLSAQRLLSFQQALLKLLLISRFIMESLLLQLDCLF
jgi:hypothetical protein